MKIEHLNSYDEVAKFLAGPGKRALYFSTTVCVTCKTWKPLVEGYFEQWQVPIHEVNLMELPKLARELGVMGVPSLRIYEDGKEIGEFSNHHTKSQIATVLG